MDCMGAASLDYWPNCDEQRHQLALGPWTNLEVLLRVRLVIGTLCPISSRKNLTILLRLEASAFHGFGDKEFKESIYFLTRLMQHFNITACGIGLDDS